jgi:hypothetical protein
MMADPSGELSGDTITRIVRGRRAAIRMRTYYLVGAVACLMAALQLTLSAILGIRANPLQATPFLASAVLFGLIARVLIRKVQALGREIRTTTIPEPTRPPDFSSLSDGSQFATNLDKLRPGPDRQKDTDQRSSP